METKLFSNVPPFFILLLLLLACASASSFESPVIIPSAPEKIQIPVQPQQKQQKENDTRKTRNIQRAKLLMEKLLTEAERLEPDILEPVIAYLEWKLESNSFDTTNFQDDGLISNKKNPEALQQQQFETGSMEMSGKEMNPKGLDCHSSCTSTRNFHECMFYSCFLDYFFLLNCLDFYLCACNCYNRLCCPSDPGLN